jgi:hypothetical protein
MQGMLFVAALAFFPGGIAGLLRSGWQRVAALAHRSSPA